MAATSAGTIDDAIKGPGAPMKLPKKKTGAQKFAQSQTSTSEKRSQKTGTKVATAPRKKTGGGYLARKTG
jgi:hypothetical protein